ncbi:MAG: glycosyltransferase family 4 protein [Deltaproteobacteria bacterium]|nr:glycosyltransferase family 4 protein [Deltaproteobacteria bacterium]
MAATRPHLFVLNERDLANPLAGGAEVHQNEVFGRLAARGFPVTVVCAGYPGAPPVGEERGMRVLHAGNRYTFYLRGPLVAHRLVRDVGDRALLVENLNKLPFYGPLWSNVPVLGLVHHLFGATAFRQERFPIAAATYLSERPIPWVYRRVPMIAVSPSTRDDLIARGVPAANVTFIPNGLDHERYRPAGQAPGPTVLSLGRVETYKRIDVVIDAMPRVLARVPAAKLVIVGRGEAVADLERRVARLRLASAVEFRGFVDEAEKVALYQSARVFVNPSEKEGWGLTVLEAAACGAPAVASDSPGLRDSVRHDESGLLVPHGDVGACAAAMLRLLSEDATWESLRAGALAWAARFTWDSVTDQIEAVIDRVAGFGVRT